MRHHTLALALASALAACAPLDGPRAGRPQPLDPRVDMTPGATQGSAPAAKPEARVAAAAPAPAPTPPPAPPTPPPTPPTPPAAAPPPPAAPEAAPAPATPVAVPLERAPEIIAFIEPGRAQPKDGSTTADWEGPGKAQMRLSREALERRNEQLSEADMVTKAFLQRVRTFYDSPGDQPTTEVREQLVQAQKLLDEARETLLAAVDEEQKRLGWVQRAVRESGDLIPNVDPKLVDRRLESITAGKLKATVEARIRAYRSLATGIVAFIDGETLVALERMREAVRDDPDLALAHAYLGSLYYVFQQPKLALAAWKRAADLDPQNRAVKQAIHEHQAEVK